MTATAVRRGGGKGAWLRNALAFSLALHLGVVIWLYQAKTPVPATRPVERIIPVFIVPPKPAPKPPPPPPEEPLQRRKEAGGRAGEGMRKPAVPIREPDRIVQPEQVLPVPPTRNPDPNGKSLNGSTGQGVRPGDGRGAAPGPGSGVGVGQGNGPGGGPRAAPDWRPRWLRKPTREQVNGAYPKPAWDKGRSGGALLECTVRVSGRVTDCVVRRESPPGQGFGEAVLKLSRHFRIEPRRIDGRAVEARLEIPYLLLMDPAQTERRERDSESANRLKRKGAPIETVPPPN